MLLIWLLRYAIELAPPTHVEPPLYTHHMIPNRAMKGGIDRPFLALFDRFFYDFLS